MAATVDRHRADRIARAEDLQDDVGAPHRCLEDLHATGQHGIEKIRSVTFAEERRRLVELSNRRHRRDPLPVLRRQPAEDGAAAKRVVDLLLHAGRSYVAGQSGMLPGSRRGDSLGPIGPGSRSAPCLAEARTPAGWHPQTLRYAHLSTRFKIVAQCRPPPSSSSTTNS